ncbi:MAG: YccF domain-containing protein [Eubacterium sp.]
MKTLGNIIWFLFGGLFQAILWVIAGILCCITIIGIPLGIQSFKFAQFVLWPFGREIDFSQMGTGSVLLNVLWIIFFGWELAFASIVFGVIYCITIIGIPFGIQCFKFTKLALMPFGAEIVRSDG